MENTGVICDVHACAHYLSGNKCNLSEIKVTEHCEGCEQKVDEPHFCQSYEQR